MNEVVVDASSFAKLLVDEPGSERVLELEAESRFIAPDFLLIEIANVLWKKVRWAGLPHRLAVERLEQVRRFDVDLIAVGPLLPQAFALACELPHPLYDVLYLLVALRGGHPLVTADAKMRQAAEALGINVEWVGANCEE